MPNNHMTTHADRDAPPVHPSGGRRVCSARTPRRLTLALCAAPLACAIAVAFSATLAAARAPEAVGSARSMYVKDEGRLHLISESGSNLVEEGPATGTLPGRVRVSFNVGPTIYAWYTLYVKGGTISGKGHGTLHGTGAYATFGGTLSVTGGTGRFAHAHGTGGLYGSINRKSSSYPMTVQTIGRLYF